MWAAIPLSQLGTWDGNCIYKIKDGSRRCKLSAGGDTDARRFGNRDELLAKISQGVSLTGQEKTELARGLCCLRWHSTGDIAREICDIWAKLPATALVPLPSLRSEVQRLKEEKEVLAAHLRTTKAMKKHYYESWIGTFTQVKRLKAEIEELKKTLKTRKVDEVSEDGNESLTTKFGTPKKRVLPQSTADVPIVMDETSRPVTPVKSTIMSKIETPANTKLINSHALEDSGYFSQASTRDGTSSAQRAYSASPTRRPRGSSSSSKSLIRVENGHEDFDIANPDFSPITPFSATTSNFEVDISPSKAAISLNKFPPHNLDLAPILASATPQSTSRRELMKMEPSEVSPRPMSCLLEKLLKNFLGVIIFCLAGNLSFVQFTVCFFYASIVVWAQIAKGNSREMQQEYYSSEDCEVMGPPLA